MKKQTWFLLVAVLLLIAGTAGFLARYKTHQKLGEPGVKTSALPGTHRLKIELPAQVIGYTSVWTEIDKVSLSALPKDTSFGNRLYTAPDGFQLRLQAVMMGTDRTSIHKPQFCLQGMGLGIRQTESVKILIQEPVSYELPVTKMTVSPEDPAHAHVRALYVYWFVADDAVTAAHWERMWWMARDLVGTGVLQRWTYLSCFAQCAPGQEDATFERIKAFIADAVPQFHLTPKLAQSGAGQP